MYGSIEDEETGEERTQRRSGLLHTARTSSSHSLLDMVSNGNPKTCSTKGFYTSPHRDEFDAQSQLNPSATGVGRGRPSGVGVPDCVKAKHRPGSRVVMRVGGSGGDFGSADSVRERGGQRQRGGTRYRN